MSRVHVLQKSEDLYKPEIHPNDSRELWTSNNKVKKIVQKQDDHSMHFTALENLKKGSFEVASLHLVESHKEHEQIREKATISKPHKPKSDWVRWILLGFLGLLILVLMLRFRM